MGSKLLAKDLGNQSEGIVLVDSGSRKIVNICDFGSKKQEQIERWLEEEISRKYGERDSIILKNPLIRIITRFEALDTKSKYELYRYAKARIFESGQDLSLRDKFWNVVEKGGSDGSWEDVEKFADTLLIREKIYKRTVGGI